MRITGGRYRGRKIIAPTGDATRPTSSVVREAVYNIFAEGVVGAKMLDLFCGSGIMSLEAISRGAAHSTMVDLQAQAVKTARKNAQELGVLSQCSIYQNDYERVLLRLLQDQKTFTFGYIDPPYRQQEYYEKALTLTFSGLFEADALCVCEFHTKDDFHMEGASYRVQDIRKYGSRSIAIIRRA